MFASKVGTGEAFASPTIAWAARWKTVSTSCSASSLATSSGSRISPVTSTTSAAIP